ncbi:hypothetical protein PILCRDRAFT_16018 [Piloderma croceum F 1598]|uniref:Uncharacterized protein n=1 Tax=Piloderma croceum (strain F 1598) TaxID=765440 RepID=A0A0C3AFI3_PILCF|nr:hypothetical protein PILCRDRAFT_16018 [Piloderma croceum F 1598]
MLKEIKGAGSVFAAVGSFSNEVTAGYGEGEQGEHWAGEMMGSEISLSLLI